MKTTNFPNTMLTYRHHSATLLLLVITALTARAFSPEATTAVRQQIETLLQDKKATVGVACSLDGHDFVLNDSVRYPLMSVFKLHVAVAALQRMEAEGTRLDELLTVDSAQMHRDTYSPLLGLYPSGNFRISYADLLHYALAQSDNNACDILITYAGGIGAVKRCIDRAGITGYDLTETEASMHADIPASYRNWAHPSSVVQLLQKILDGSLLNEEHTRFMRTTLVGTSTGLNKIRAGLPPEIILGHKTGSSGQLPDGLTIADNDAGFFYLPDGRLCLLVILVKDSRESDTTSAALIARIARIVYDAATANQPSR